MTELKTLKELARSKAYWNLSETELKAEAVNWVKSNELSVRTDKWIKHFFNLTEEDLK